jgi:hypothetical protein
VSEIALTRIGYSDCQQFIQHVADDLDGMRACLMTYWIPHKELGTCESRGLSDFRAVILQVW